MCHSFADVVISVVSSTGGETITVLEETPVEEVCVQLESLPAGGLEHDITLSLKPVAISACEFQPIFAPFNYFNHTFINTASQDFSSNQFDITISTGALVGEKFCHSLQTIIENDDIIENTEKIQIQISQSDPPNTLTARSSVEVLIEDGDGMLLPI